eukprot:g9786.t1
MLCVMATWAMLLFSVYVVTFVLLRPTPFEQCLSAPKVLTSLAFVALAGFAATAHVRTMLTDPGAVPRNATPLPLPSDDDDNAADDEEACAGRGGGAAAGAAKAAEDEEEDEVAETSRLTASSSSYNPSAAAAVAVGLGPPNRLLPPESGGVEGAVAAAGRGGVLRTSSGQRKAAGAAATAGDEEQRQQRVVKWCYKCDAFKPPRAHHCSLCQRCIVKMDHHCPWVNNCVGVANQKLFLLFCAYTCALCVFALTIELVVVVIVGDKGRVEACRLTAGDHAATVALAAMSMMFGLFTCCMACDQCQVAQTNLTKIDRLKGELHDSAEGSNEVFGGEDGQKCRCHWLLPRPAQFPPGSYARILGYCTGTGSRGGGGGGGSRGGTRGQAQALMGSQRSLGGGGAAAVSELELAENGGGSAVLVSRSNGHDPFDAGGGRKGRAYPATEAELGLRHSARQSLEERLEGMPEVDSGSEGEFR